MTPTAHISRVDAAASLGAKLDDRTLRCGIVGLGFVGTLIAQGLAEAGFPVDGYDRSPEAVAQFCATDGLETAHAGSSGDRLADADAIVIAVRMAPGHPSAAWSEPLASVGALISGLPREPRLIVLASTTPVGATRSFASRWTPGDTTFVVHAPERMQVGSDLDDVKSIPHLVGGLDPVATELGARLIRSYCAEVVPVASPEISELSKLLENAFRAVGIALISEVTKVAHAAGAQASDVATAAATKPFGYFPFHPGAGVGGHCIPNDLEILRASAAAENVLTPLLEAAGRALGEMPSICVDRLEDLLEERGSLLREAQVLIVGTGFKVGSGEQMASPAEPIVRCLRARGASPCFLDSSNDQFIVDGCPVPRLLASTLAPAMFDAVLVVSGDDDVTVDQICGSSAIVLDVGGGAILAGDTSAMMSRL